METILKLRLVRALSHRPVLVLWAGQAFSAIGDEVYKVALIWLAVGMIGEDAGQSMNYLIVTLIPIVRR